MTEKTVAVPQALIAGMAAELQRLAQAIARLGDDLSAPGAAALQLQLFDVLAQQAGAQGELLAGLARGDAPGPLIARIPFHDVRLRLSQAAQHTKPARVETDVEWF